MKPKFDLEQAIEIVTPYLTLIKQVQEESFNDTDEVKDLFFNKGIPITMTPKAKGSLMSNDIKARLETAIASDPKAKVIEVDGYNALYIENKVLIRFNKLDNKYKSSIQKRKNYWKFVNQGEHLEGFEADVVRLWAGFTPIDKQWSSIARYSLVCFDAGKVIWFNNLTNHYTVKQLPIPLEQPVKRRTKLRKGNNEQETNTGTGK